MKRKVKICVISDVHLGTYGCHAKEALQYLRSISPEVLILNGDIFDIWQFSKNYWPQEHMLFAKHLVKLITKGTEVHYITGNHDEMLRKFAGFSLNNFSIVNKVILDIDGKKTWFFHGDVFDTSISTAKWLAKLGGKGYDLLILLNRLFNRIAAKFGRGRISLSKRVKESVKKAVNHISNWEQTVADMAEFHGFDHVVCGHIHRPEIKTMTGKKGQTITYLNSGDWVESCTALEYNDGQWQLFDYWAEGIAEDAPLDEEELDEISTTGIFNALVKEFQVGSLQ